MSEEGEVINYENKIARKFIIDKIEFIVKNGFSVRDQDKLVKYQESLGDDYSDSAQIEWFMENQVFSPKKEVILYDINFKTAMKLMKKLIILYDLQEEFDTVQKKS